MSPIPDRRSFRLRRRALRLAWPALLAAALAGCAGGSGSSGFISPAVAERMAIDAARDSGGCVPVEGGGLVICAADGERPAPAPSATPSPTRSPTTEGPDLPTATPSATPRREPTARVTATPTATAAGEPTPAAPSVDTNIGPDGVLGCTVVGPACLALFSFAPSGFPPGSVFTVAVRSQRPGSDWFILTPRGDGASFDLPIEVLEPLAGDRIEIAVLIFFAPPPPLPERVAVLAESGADVAYVTGVVTVTP